MKVTVNFGAVRVIVPCGKGDLPVKQLMDLAITRYKKATGKSLDSWVTIHNLKLLSDGGILDPDDKLNDVADDREQITAVFDEEISSYLMHNGGDGTSASSIGTESPDIFQNGDILTGFSKSSYNGSDVEITEEKISSGLLPLHVRRGSEPALNQLPPSLLQNSDNCKRWSAAVLASSDNYKQLNSEGEEQSEDDIPSGEREDGSGEEKSMSLQNYLTNWSRDSLLNMDQRREPLGGPVTLSKYSTSETEDSDSSSSTSKKKFIEIMKLKNEDGPLGIRIVPADDSPERNEGVVIEGIEPGGRIDRDGRFAVGDRITEINGLKLGKDSYKNAQEMLKDAMKAPELSIHCIKKEFNTKNAEENLCNGMVVSKPLPSTPKKESDENGLEFEKAKTLPVPIMPLLTPKKLQSTLLHKGTPVHSSIRKVGRRILVHLTKGQEGLGFSITSKDPNNGPPFFIKNILPAGAAVDDGRLKTGDKLIEVNKVDVSNMTQAEVLGLLRRVPFNDVVELIISRQETDFSPSPSLPRQLPLEKCEDEVEHSSSKKRDVFTYKVPLNDTGSAGLGVSVKGKTSNTASGAVDMGIFIKNILHGGAAYKDGRLCNNDQLLNVNGISLLGMTNGQATETLRRAMIQSEGPTVVSNAIILTVARRVPSSSDNRSDPGSSCHDRSDSLLSESGDSFYVSNENLSSNKCNGQTPDTSTSDHSNNTVIHISPLKKITDHIEEETDDLLETSRDYTSGNYNSVLNRLTAEHNLDINNVNRKSRLNSPVHFKRNCGTVQENELLSIADVHEQDEHLIDFNSPEETDYTFVSNHKKSLSSPVKTDFSHEPYFEDEVNAFDSETPQYPKPYDNRSVHSKKNQFQRSGFGRQSMPEKMFSPTYQRNKYLSPRNFHENETEERNSRIHSPSPESQNLYNKHPVIREMPVDVGPCESYVKLQPKRHHRSKGSCNSPDCPYHAVPTRRESGSSEETSCVPVGPSLGLIKSSSLESLQTMVQEQQKQGLSTPLANSIASRGCNESFRAAVDKSFEAIDQTEGSTSQAPKNPQTTNATRNHTRAKTVDVLTEQFKKNEKVKKKGIFRGLGSMFRFGKSNKKGNKEASVSAAKEFDQKKPELHATPTSALEEQNQTRCKEVTQEVPQFHQLYQPNRPLRRHLSSKPSFTFPRVGAPSPLPSQNPLVMSPHSRQERMNVLRIEHQRRHKQRNGFYPQDNEDEMFEQHLKHSVDGRAMMNRPLPPLPNQQSRTDGSQVNSLELSPKSKSLEIYKEMSKPGSRKGFADPIRYSHYMNFQEIQQHLQQFRLHQSIFLNEHPTEMLGHLNEHKMLISPHKRHYRHTVSSPRSRPNSEFIDFTSAETFKHVLRGISESGSLPRRMFQNNKQRPPIPSSFLFQQRHGQPITNGYAVDSYNQSKINDLYKSGENGTSSKV